MIKQKNMLPTMPTPLKRKPSFDANSVLSIPNGEISYPITVENVQINMNVRLREIVANL
jgi:hypothetical protein